MSSLKSPFTKTEHDNRVCPWWMCFTFDNIFRRLIHNPEKILGPHVKPGQTVLDVGPGMGYFTIPLARLVGPTGKVIAADVQKQMLDRLVIRAQRAGVSPWVRTLLSLPERIGLAEPLNFCLAFWMLHEVPDQGRFLQEISTNLKPGGLMLIVEPRMHVKAADFSKSLNLAERVGLKLQDSPGVALSHAALLKKV